MFYTICRNTLHEHLKNHFDLVEEATGTTSSASRYFESNWERNILCININKCILLYESLALFLVAESDGSRSPEPLTTMLHVLQC